MSVMVDAGKAANEDTFDQPEMDAVVLIDQHEASTSITPQQEHDEGTSDEQTSQRVDIDDIQGKIFIGGLSWQTTEGKWLLQPD